MKIAWLYQSRGVHEDRLIRAFERYGYEVRCFTFNDFLVNPKTLLSSSPDFAVGGPLHIGRQYFDALQGIHFIALSYAYDILYEPLNSETARESVLAALSRCCGLIADCNAVINAAFNLLGTRLPPFLKCPWGLERLAHTNAEQHNQVGEIFDNLKQRGVNRVLICTRNLTVLHGTMRVVEAFLMLAQRYPSLGLVLVGDGPLRAEIEQLIKKAKLLPHVAMTGMLAEAQVVECLRRADYFVSAAKVDGTSISLLQALDAGLPIVIPDVGGNSEWAALTDGCITFVNESSKSLADALEVALSRWQPGVRFDRQMMINEYCDWDRNSKEIVTFCQRQVSYLSTRCSGNKILM